MPEVDLSSFPGLDLRDEAGMLGACDIRDVRWASDGSLASSDGSSAWGSVTGLVHQTGLANWANVEVASFSTQDPVDRRRVFVLGASTFGSQGSGSCCVLRADGTQAVALQVVQTAQPRSLAKFATPAGVETVFITGARDAIASYFREYTLAGGLVASSGFQTQDPISLAYTAAAVPAWDCVAAWPTQNRLVGGGIIGTAPGSWGGVALDSSMVWFSQPANPKTYTNTHFARCGYGDGERVTAIVPWRDLLFVFKRSRFWVFTGLTADSQGTVTFQRRAIDAGAGCVGPAAAVAAPDALYFLSNRGVYRTTGGEPECISQALNPLFGIGRMPSFYTGPLIDRSTSAYLLVPGMSDYFTMSKLTWVQDTLYVTIRGTVANQAFTLAWHEPTLRWSLLSVNAACLFGIDALGPDETYFLPDQSDGPMQRIQPGLAGHASTTAVMRPFYLGPFRRLNNDRVTRVRELKAWGGGTVDVGMAVDFERSVRSENLVLTSSLPGTSREARVARANQFKASYGAVYLGNSPATKALERQWAVQRVIADVSGAKSKAQPDQDG